jgi:hypothetical protein
VETRGRYDSTEAARWAVARYVEVEVDHMGYVAQKVRHVELVRRERLFGDVYQVWDVHTNKGRWWVVEPVMNLYSQRRHKSIDEVLSFHVGLTFRIGERDSGRRSEERPTAGSWRHLREASEGLKVAEEAVEFQAIGVALREALLALVREEALPEAVPPGQTVPQTGNFLEWSRVLADYMVPEPNRQELRAYAREAARVAWTATGWLVHARDASYWDAELVHQAVENVLALFSLARVRRERRRAEECPSCGSRRVDVEFANGLDDTEGFMKVCLRCNWTGERWVPERG